jgi:putative oxidoreductase
VQLLFEVGMQRLFSTFAGGRPGIGLLLQRALIAAIIANSFITNLSKAHHFSAILAQLIAAGAGLLLLIGLWSPIAGAVVAFVEIWIVFSRTGDPWMPCIVALLAATLAMIGPGAWSMDAHLFGRKHIQISRE